MKTLPKHFVNPDAGQWNVISETVCPYGGNTYQIDASGFDTETQAQAHADLMNESAGDRP